MRGGEVLKRARTRAGLSIDELAQRLEVEPGQLTSWEAGDPAFSIVERIADACGASLTNVLAEPDPDPHDLSLLDETLRLTPEQRLQRMLSYVRFIQAGRAAMRAAQ